VEASTSADTALGQQWTIVAEPGRVINLLDLQAGTTTLIGEVDLPAGQYRAIRVTINTALSSVVGIDGTHWPVAWGVPGPLTMYALVEDELAIPSDGARIVIDFDVGRSFQILGDQLVFLPWLRAINESVTGSISGTVGYGTSGSPLGNVFVSAYGSGHGLVATGRTDALGHYTVAFLRAGTYRVVMEGPATIEGERGPCITVESVSVTAGAVSTVNRVLPATDPPCGEGAGPGPDSTGTPGGGTVGGAVETVTVALGRPAGPVVVGDSLPLAAILKDAAGVSLYGRTVTWATSNAAVVSLEGTYGPYANGRAKATGTATLTASSEEKVGSLTIEVQ
jgi:hypothetical protein